MKICTCHTPDCPNEDALFKWDDSPPLAENGETVTMNNPWCGGCSTQFSDITDVEEPATGS